MAQPGMWRRTYPGPRLPPRSWGPALPRRMCPRLRRTRRCQGQRRLGQPRLPVLALHPTSALRCPPGDPCALSRATVLPGPPPSGDRPAPATTSRTGASAEAVTTGLRESSASSAASTATDLSPKQQRIYMQMMNIIAEAAFENGESKEDSPLTPAESKSLRQAASTLRHQVAADVGAAHPPRLRWTRPDPIPEPPLSVEWSGQDPRPQVSEGSAGSRD